MYYDWGTKWSKLSFVPHQLQNSQTIQSNAKFKIAIRPPEQSIRQSNPSARAINTNTNPAKLSHAKKGYRKFLSHILSNSY